MNEKSLFIRGLIAWMGFKQCPMEYQREARYAGETKYPLKKMVALAADAILAFSEKPLRLISKIGLSIFLIAVSTSVFVLLAPLYTTEYQAPGWLSLMLVLLTFGGFQVLCLGVIGSYVLRIYRQTKNRPIYIVMDEFKKIG
jgi:dolichol-phosphate mannosyltransferase